MVCIYTSSSINELESIKHFILWNIFRKIILAKQLIPMPNTQIYFTCNLLKMKCKGAVKTKGAR